MWKLLKPAEVVLRVGVVIAVVYLAYVFLARRSSTERFLESRRKAEPSTEAIARYQAAYGGKDLRILAFYAKSPILEGEGTNLCYGVLNAKSLRVDPPVANLYPALSRCVAVAPDHDTRYVLTAEGTDGATKTAELNLRVTPDVANYPRITSFGVARDNIEHGRHFYTIAFAFENANKVMIDPPVFDPLEDSAPFGQTVVSPDGPTTYTLTVVGKKGRTAQKKLTLGR